MVYGFISWFSKAGDPKRWFTKVYIAFMGGITHSIYMLLPNVTMPLGDPHLSTRAESKLFENNEQYQNTVFDYKELNKLNINYNHFKIDNIQKGSEIMKGLYEIISSIVPLKNIRNNTVHSYKKISIIGKIYRPTNMQSVNCEMSQNSQELFINKQLVINNTININNETRSGVIIKANNKYMHIQLPHLPPYIENTHKGIINTKYASGYIKWIPNVSMKFEGNKQVVSALRNYFESIRSVLPKNVQEILIAQNVYIGEYNSKCDDIYDLNIVNALQIVPSTASSIEEAKNSLALECMKSMWHANTTNMIYEYNNGIIDKIEGEFTIYEDEIDATNIRSYIMAQKGKILWISKEAFMLVDDIKVIAERQNVISSSDLVPRWAYDICTIFINSEYHKAAHER